MLKGERITWNAKYSTFYDFRTLIPENRTEEHLLREARRAAILTLKMDNIEANIDDIVLVEHPNPSSGETAIIALLNGKELIDYTNPI